MGITVFPPSTSSGSSGGSEKPYKCIPACGAVAAGDFVSIFPGECVVRSSVKGADQDCFTCFFNGNGTQNTLEGAWNVAVPFLCANNCYAVVSLQSGRKCTDGFAECCWRCPCILINAVTVNSDQSTTCCAIYSCCILIGTESWQCYNSAGECCCANLNFLYAPIVLPSCVGHKTAVFLPKNCNFLKCNSNTCICDFYQQEIWLCYNTSTNVVSVICNCCNIEGISTTATNFCKCDNFYYFVSNDRKYLVGQKARGFPSSAGDSGLKKEYIVKCLNDNSYLGITAATVTGFNPCSIWCSTCCTQFSGSASFGAFGWAPFSQGCNGWMIGRFIVDKNPQTSSCCCFFTKTWAIKPTADCAITMSANILCDVDGSCNLVTSRTGFFAIKEPKQASCRFSPESNTHCAVGFGRVWDEGDDVKKILLPTFVCCTGCCRSAVGLSCFCIDGSCNLTFMGGQVCDDNDGLMCCNCSSGSKPFANAYYIDVNNITCRFYQCGETHRCSLFAVQCLKGGEYGGNFGCTGDTFLYYNSYPTCIQQGRYRTALPHQYIHGSGIGYDYSRDALECAKLPCGTGCLTLVEGTDGQEYQSASEYKLCACTTCWNVKCNALVTKILDGICAGDRTVANNFFHPGSCCLSFSGGFFPLGSSTTAFITAQGPSNRRSQWCSCCQIGARMWSHVYHTNVKCSTIGRMYGIAQNTAANGETVCVAVQGTIDKSPFTCTHLAAAYTASGPVAKEGGLCCGVLGGFFTCKCGDKHTKGSGAEHVCYFRGFQQGSNCTNCQVRFAFITPYYDSTEEHLVGKVSSRKDKLDDI